MFELLLAVYIVGIIGVLIVIFYKSDNETLEKKFAAIPNWFKGAITILWPIAFVISVFRWKEIHKWIKIAIYKT